MSSGYSYSKELNPKQNKKLPSLEDLKIFSRVISLVEDEYVKEVSRKKLIEGAIIGLFKELDPYSTYLGTQELKRMKEDTLGRFAGIGLEISQEKDHLVVISAIAGGPSSRAGINPGDWIIRIDKKKTENMTLMQISRSLRGKRGTIVKLKILRPSEGKVLSFSIVRDIIKINPVDSLLLRGGILFARIRNFQENTWKVLKKQLKIVEGKKRLKGLILDLRGNPGGLFNEAVKLCRLFIKTGVIVSTKGRTQGATKIYKAMGSSEFGHLPLIVLINRGSASASEIVAAALQENHRALVIGEKSFGKGSVQEIVELPGEIAVKLTVSHYFTPKGNSIQNMGVKPNLKFSPAKTLSVKNFELLARAIKARSPLKEQRFYKKNDALLGQANQLIRAQIWEKDRQFLKLKKSLDIVSTDKK